MGTKGHFPGYGKFKLLGPRIEMRCGCSVVISLSVRLSTISLKKETYRTLWPFLMKFGVKLACDVQMCLFMRLILSVGPCPKMGSKGWKWYFHIFLNGAFILHPILLRFFSLDFLQKCLSQIFKQIRHSSYRFRDIRGQKKPTPKIGTFL